MKEDNIIMDSDEEKIYIEHLYTVEDYFTFNIKIKSGEFSGASNFCIARENIVSIIENLSEMYTELKGYCEINDCDSDANIKMKMDKYGHVFVFGQIGGSHEEHSMKFRFNTDQTVLNRLIKMLKTILN